MKLLSVYLYTSRCEANIYRAYVEVKLMALLFRLFENNVVVFTRIE